MTALIYVIILTCAAMAYGSSPFRGECKREAKFTGIKGHVLANHVIASHNVTSGEECSLECLQNTKCVSYNYEETEALNKTCELNDQTMITAPRSDKITKPGYSYHDAQQFVLPVCASSPCLNNGTCIDECLERFVCNCPDEYNGERCESWFGFNGSSPKFPSKSCLNIKISRQDTGDGKYWIDPLNTGNPFQVICDMTTDGGGWTVVKNITIPTLFNKTQIHVNEYDQIQDLGIYHYLNSKTLQKLKTDMGFTQLRYYCHMALVGTTFHVMTAQNTTGYDVVRYFVSSPNPQVSPCGSFIALPDDNSTLSNNCDKWGSIIDGALVNRWGEKRESWRFKAVHNGGCKIWRLYLLCG